jgi:hypothetical protein
MSFESLKPSALLLKLRVARAKKRALRRAEGSKNSSTQEIFSEIYRKGLWGNSEDPEKRYYSGSGSHDENLTSVYLGNIEMLLRSLPNKPEGTPSCLKDDCASSSDAPSSTSPPPTSP